MDFSSLVLAPNMLVFGIPILVTPTFSQSDAPNSYAATAIWESKHADVLLDDGTVVSSNQIDVGIRLSDYPVPPVKGDGIQVAGVDYNIFDTQADGQGGSKLILRFA